MSDNNGWEPIDTAPKTGMLQLWTGSNQYFGHWAQNPFTGDVSFIVCNLESGDQVLIKPTHFKELDPNPKEQL